jgi:HSP20 family molecular chaperone IbpA
VQLQKGLKNMAETEVKKVEEKESKTRESPKKKYLIMPHYSWDYDCETSRLTYEVGLAGVSKENIKLKVTPGLFHMEAKRTEKKSEALFELTRYFMGEVEPKSAEAKFDSGLLKFSVKIKNPMDEAVEVKL